MKNKLINYLDSIILVVIIVSLLILFGMGIYEVKVSMGNSLVSKCISQMDIKNPYHIDMCLMIMENNGYEDKGDFRQDLYDTIMKIKKGETQG